MHRSLPMVWILCASGILLFAMITYSLFQTAAFHNSGGDFSRFDFMNYWGAPQLAAADVGQLFSVDRYNVGLARLTGATAELRIWSYPLHGLLLLTPLSKLPVAIAWWLWTILGLILYGAVIARGLPKAQRRTGLILALLAPASLLNILYGQNGLFTGALFLGALMWLHARPRVSGVLLGLLTIKPQLGLLWPILLLQQRRWQTIFIAVLVCCALLGLSIAWYGMAAWRDYFDTIIPLQMSLINSPPMMHTFEPMMPTMPLSLQLWGMTTHAAFVCQWVLASCMAIALMMGLRRRPDLATTALLLSSAAMLVTPYAFNYDMTVLGGALVWYLLAHPHLGRGALIIYGLGYLLPVLTYPLYFLFPVAPFITLAVFVLTLYRLWGKEQS